MNFRIFIFGVAAGAAIAAIVFFAIQSEHGSTTTAKSEVAANRESRALPADAPSPQPRNMAEAVSGSESSEPGNSQSQSDESEPSRVLTPEQLESKWNAEARDVFWAAPVEMALGDFLARQPHPNALGSPSVECRATLCRVETSVDATVFRAAPNADLQAAMGHMRYESLGRQLDLVAERIPVSPDHPGQITTSAYLQRVEP